MSCPLFAEVILFDQKIITGYNFNRSGLKTKIKVEEEKLCGGDYLFFLQC
jgi:hypothetical protein